MIGITHLINNIIMNKEANTNNIIMYNTESPMYQEEYTYDPFSDGYLGKCVFVFVLLPLLVIYLRMVYTMQC